MPKSRSGQTQLLAFFAGLLLSAVVAQGQAPKGDFSTMVAAGKVNGDAYQNPYLGITLSAPKAHWEVRGPISVQGQKARLITAVYDSGVPERGPEENYTLDLLVESRENFSKGTTLEQYVKNVRHRADDGKMKIFREEFPLTVQGVAFVGMVFQFFERQNFGYYRAFYSTIIDEYFVTIEVQCGREGHLQKLLSSALQVQPKRGAVNLVFPAADRLEDTR